MECQLFFTEQRKEKLIGRWKCFDYQYVALLYGFTNIKSRLLDSILFFKKPFLLKFGIDKLQPILLM